MQHHHEVQHGLNNDHSNRVKVGINGFGRIGRLFARVLFQNKTGENLSLVAINDPKLDAAGMAYLLKYDSVHGTCCCDIEVEGGNVLKINGHSIHIFSELDASQVPWGNVGVQVVAETSGAYTSKEKAEAHLQAGAQKVVISAPAKNVPHFVLGVNNEKYDPSMSIISNASCTTNCLAPLAKLLNDIYGIEEGIMTTVHAVTATQSVVDGPSKKDFRAGRCATRNIIPASTGATQALTRVLPELDGKVSGIAFRVPVENVSVVDFTCRLSKPMESIESFVNQIDRIDQDPTFPLHHIIGVTRDPVVSSDFNGDERSCIVDAHASILLNPQFVKIVAYYDNEWAYAVRLAELVGFITKTHSGK